MEEYILIAFIIIMVCCVFYNICIDVGDFIEIDFECDEDSDSLIIFDGYE